MGDGGALTQGPPSSGWMASRVCAYFRLVLAAVDSQTLARGKSSKPVMGPVLGQCTVVCSLATPSPSIWNSTRPLGPDGKSRPL